MVRCNSSHLVAITKWFLGRVHSEYLTATEHYRHVRAQTPSVYYGGSRSFVYFELLNRAQNLEEILQARARYRACHAGKAQALRDEYGGILRIVGYRSRKVPLIGAWLEGIIRADDDKMTKAIFNYPDIE